MINNLSKIVIENGGELLPLIIPAEYNEGMGLCNPSILVDDSSILVNIRNVHYTLHHNEGARKFQSSWSGPLQYLNPEDDLTLTSKNFLCELDPITLNITSINKIDTSKLDVKPLWEFVGLEDARLAKWDDTLYAIGVRRDTTTNGKGRMEFSTIEDNKEIKRNRIEAPVDTYLEKNWMPILDMPYHFIKFANPLEIVKADLDTNTSKLVLSKPFTDKAPPNLRGGSAVITIGEFRIALTHEVYFPYNPQNNKDANYKHQFVVWDKDWNVVYTTPSFSFMTALIEFSCGMAQHGDDILVTFGFQDNAAYILRIPFKFFSQFTKIDDKFKDFDWGDLSKDSWFMNLLHEELVVTNVYERYFKVKKGDIVVDVGASVGPFANKILEQKPSAIYCLEPQKSLYKTLDSNFKDHKNVTCVNKGISHKSGNVVFHGLYEDAGHLTGSKPTISESIKFTDFIKTFNINQIDFLKTDSEGAEYDIFNNENKKWIIENVKKIAGEFHLHNIEYKEKFRIFRDNYLKHFSNYEVFSIDGIDIKWDLFNEHFIEYYSEVFVYINNESKEYWKTTPYPTLEFTTSVPPNGCVVNCSTCPQSLLTKVYDGKNTMSLDDFKLTIDKLPAEVRIIFSGFTEPWLNSNTTDMLLYAHEAGHSIAVFTTGVGMTIDDIKKIKHIPFDKGPNGGFCLHLPDKEKIGKHPINKRYLAVLEYFNIVQHEISGFYTMSFGPVIDEIAGMFKNPNIPNLYSRAGNLFHTDNHNIEFEKIKDRIVTTKHSSEKKTCGIVEKLYHNVIMPDGNVYLCCMDYGLTELLGNLYTQKYENIIPIPNKTFDLCQKCENGISI